MKGALRLSPGASRWLFADARLSGSDFPPFATVHLGRILDCTESLLRHHSIAPLEIISESGYIQLSSTGKKPSFR